MRWWIRPAVGKKAFAWVHDDLTTPAAVTRSTTSGAAAVIWRASYAPFGLAAVDEGPDGETQLFSFDLLSPGQVFDAESGLHYNWSYPSLVDSFRSGVPGRS